MPAVIVSKPMTWLLEIRSTVRWVPPLIKQGVSPVIRSLAANLIFRGVLGTGIFRVFDLAVAQTGLSEREAKAQGFYYCSLP